MLQTIEATIDENGHVQLLEPIRLSEPRRAFVTILPGESDTSMVALLSEAALAEDRNCPEEDRAWSHLQQMRKSYFRCQISNCQRQKRTPIGRQQTTGLGCSP